ncbi:peptide-methionine (S)-S-oxide reductase [Joostella sp. CR20]
MMKVALSGSCYWCMEAIYQSLIGVDLVEQGFVSSDDDEFSEAIIVHFQPEVIDLKTLIEIHLHTHKCTVNHSWRDKYKSAVYVFSEAQKIVAEKILEALQGDFSETIITKVLMYKQFKPSEEMFHNYYYNNPEKPFCERYIHPKLKKILTDFSEYADSEKLKNV